MVTLLLGAESECVVEKLDGLRYSLFWLFLCFEMGIKLIVERLDSEI